VSTTEFVDDVDGTPPVVRCWRVQQHPLPILKTTSMAGPYEELLAGPVASSVEFEEDVHGGLLGGTIGGSSSVHHRG
jgi:hypothetical protein